MTNKQISIALQTLRPLAAWALIGDDLADLQWLDQVQSRPTDEEIIAAIDAYVPPPTLQDQIKMLQDQVAALLARPQ